MNFPLPPWGPLLKGVITSPKGGSFFDRGSPEGGNRAGSSASLSIPFPQKRVGGRAIVIIVTRLREGTGRSMCLGVVLGWLSSKDVSLFH